MLRGPGGQITNPHLQNKREIYARTGGPELEEIHSVKYAWADYFRPALLATSLEMYNEGVKILYGNTFVFTRKVYDGSENRICDILEFLSCQHKYRNPGKGYGELFSRCELLKKICIQDSDQDLDSFAERGLARPLLEIPQHRSFAWNFKFIRAIEGMKMNLQQLVITMDEAAPGLAQHLEYETRMKALSQFATNNNCYGPGMQAELMARAFQYGEVLMNDDRINEPFPWTSQDCFLYVYTIGQCKIQELCVRGTSPDGNIRVYLPDGNTRVTASFAKDIQAYIGTTKLVAYRTRFTGAFEARRVHDDNSLIPTDLWIAAQVPLPPGKDLELFEPHQIALPFDITDGLPLGDITLL